ncbi:hypothetical protein [Ideonella sp. YS5]|uniref:hypothetical protein n=1 Tax=Ideonella sp. YS5 TaxID=3453714 RepID=UPI003EEF1468
MLDSEKLAIAAHLHVVMRRAMGRVTDVEWLIRSPEYAREIIRVALAEQDRPELHDWANRLQRALFGAPPSSVALPGSTVPSAAPKPPPAAKYIGRLR